VMSDGGRSGRRSCADAHSRESRVVRLTSYPTFQLEVKQRLHVQTETETEMHCKVGESSRALSTSECAHKSGLQSLLEKSRCEMRMMRTVAKGVHTSTAHMISRGKMGNQRLTMCPGRHAVSIHMRA
jgi:hypothetical protein